MKGYKTLFAAAGIFLLGILQSADFGTFLTSAGLDGNGKVTMAIAGVVAVLRLITTGPVGGK